MSQERTWQHGPVAHQYSLTVGEWQALVWYQVTEDWAALISRDHTAVHSHIFKTLMDAQLWCEEQLAKIQVPG